jgi:Tfp pilus assembly protein PilN
MNPGGTMLSEQSAMTLSLYTYILGAVVAGLLILVGIWLLQVRWWRRGESMAERLLMELHHLVGSGGGRDTQTIANLVSSTLAEHLSRRNDSGFRSVK